MATALTTSASAQTTELIDLGPGDHRVHQEIGDQRRDQPKQADHEHEAPIRAMLPPSPLIAIVKRSR